ncbi:MAG: DUF2332 domain-containing protein [Gammaproteobacteria bacterium]|nr:DUF2332 domain-containing protein [Gammaproteobacteria bacterium]
MTARSPERLRALFHRFGRVEAMELASPLYAELAYAVSESPDLLALAAQTRPHQPPPNMLFGAAQYLLLRGVTHPLAAHYPIVSGKPRPMAPAAADFRDFCRTHAGEVAELVRTRRTQTNVVRRCTCLVPAFSVVSREAQGRPLHLIDLGASAGLNLNFDRYGIRYTHGGREVLRWGDAGAVVQLEAELRGDGLPELKRHIAVGGVDLDPIDALDPEALLWLRALIWPEHVERHERLLDAAEELRKHPVRLRGGDAVETLPHLLAEAPGDEALTVYTTVALYQFPRTARERMETVLIDASRSREVWRVALEGESADIMELTLTRYRDGSAAPSELLARASPHGWWLEWAAS